jgi:1,4-alpha-glucan branching enzyme
MVICENGQKHLFRVYLPEARAVELVGSFTDWRVKPVPMMREPSGWWAAKVDMSAGDHLFSYLVNGSVWMADYAASGVKSNGYGGWVSQLSVEAETRPLQLAA